MPARAVRRMQNVNVRSRRQSSSSLVVVPTLHPCIRYQHLQLFGPPAAIPARLAVANLMPEFAFVQLPRSVRQGLQAQLAALLQYDRNVTWRQEPSTNTTFGQVGAGGRGWGCEAQE